MIASGTSTPRPEARDWRIGAAGGQVGRVDLDDHPAQEPGDQLVGQPMDQSRVLIGRQDNRDTFVDQRIVGVEELVLGRALGGEEVNIIHDQAAGASEPGSEAAQAARAHRFEEAIGERLGGDLEDVQARVPAPQGMTDRLEQMRLAHADSAVDHQGVERGTGRLGHLPRRGVRQVIAGSGHEVIESAPRPGRL